MKKYSQKFFISLMAVIFLTPAISFGQGGLVSYFLAQSFQSDSAQVLFTGPNWCGPCQKEWINMKNSGAVPNVSFVVIRASEGDKWIFPVSKLTENNRAMLNDSAFKYGQIGMFQATAEKYGGRPYNGLEVTNYPNILSVSKSLIPFFSDKTPPPVRPEIIPPTLPPPKPMPTLKLNPVIRQIDNITCRPVRRLNQIIRYECFDKTGRNIGYSDSTLKDFLTIKNAFDKDPKTIFKAVTYKNGEKLIEVQSQKTPPPVQPDNISPADRKELLKGSEQVLYKIAALNNSLKNLTDQQKIDDIKKLIKKLESDLDEINTHLAR